MQITCFRGCWKSRRVSDVPLNTLRAFFTMPHRFFLLQTVTHKITVDASIIYIVRWHFFCWSWDAIGGPENRKITNYLWQHNTHIMSFQEHFNKMCKFLGAKKNGWNWKRWKTNLESRSSWTSMEYLFIFPPFFYCVKIILCDTNDFVVVNPWDHSNGHITNMHV